MGSVSEDQAKGMFTGCQVQCGPRLAPTEMQMLSVRWDRLAVGWEVGVNDDVMVSLSRVNS